MVLNVKRVKLDEGEADNWYSESLKELQQSFIDDFSNAKDKKEIDLAEEKYTKNIEEIRDKYRELYKKIVEKNKKEIGKKSKIRLNQIKKDKRELINKNKKKEINLWKKKRQISDVGFRRGIALRNYTRWLYFSKLIHPICFLGKRVKLKGRYQKYIIYKSIKNSCKFMLNTSFDKIKSVGKSINESVINSKKYVLSKFNKKKEDKDEGKDQVSS